MTSRAVGELRVARGRALRQQFPTSWANSRSPLLARPGHDRKPAGTETSLGLGLSEELPDAVHALDDICLSDRIGEPRITRCAERLAWHERHHRLLEDYLG